MDNLKSLYTFSNRLFEELLLDNEEANLKRIEAKFNVKLCVKDSSVFILEPKDYKLNKKLSCILQTYDILLANKIDISVSDFCSLLNNIDEANYKEVENIYLNKLIILNTQSGKSIYPRTLNQKIYINALNKNDVIFALGPAGTGKTYLAVMYALRALKLGVIKKIVLVRPVVEAGEKLGFLPGDLKEKIDPYLVPLYDALYEGLGKEAVDRYLEKGIIEVAPLAYMRGRTLENALIILDEAQNANLTQMKMFLTRLGFNSKMIITGDITQIDLPNKMQSGLIEATNILGDIKGIKIIRFSNEDVMRHPLVFEIIKRYEEEGK